MEIGSKIRQVRINKGFSQENMALQLGINAKTYGKLESGLSKITIDRISVISQILEVNPFELISGDEQYSFYNYKNCNCKIINQNNDCTINERELYEKLIREKEAVIVLLREKIN